MDHKLWRGFYAEDVTILERSFSILNRFPRNNYLEALKRWKSYMKLVDLEMKRKEYAQLSREVINVIRTSVRGKRTIQEKQVIRKYLQKYAACIPVKRMSRAEVEILCDEIDIIKCLGKAIVFMQGDYGNKYYAIARGEVSLYQEPNRQKEVENARLYGHLRGMEFSGNQEDFARLGGKIATLTPGSGFGELSILSAVHKFRTASAICTTNDSLLFVLYENTYNAVLRRHHFRQQEMSKAIEFLKGIPLCNTYNYSQLAGLAYSMKTCGFEKRTVIVEAGNKISCVYIVRSGDVWVSTEAEKSSSSKKPSRMPALALCILAIGKVIGEQDILDGKITYSSSYRANSDCSLYEIPLEMYRNALKTPSVEYPATAQITKELKQTSNSRAERAKTSIASLLLNLTNDLVLKGDLMKVLPSVIEVDSTEHFLPPRTHPITVSTRPETGLIPPSFEDSFEYLNLQQLSLKSEFSSPRAPTASMRRSMASPRGTLKVEGCRN